MCVSKVSHAPSDTSVRVCNVCVCVHLADVRSPPPPLAPGCKLDGAFTYTVLEETSRGGQGRIYKAYVEDASEKKDGK